MKKISTLSLSFAYVGCFFGAGYVSGQELWQFFGAFGTMGYAGFALSVILFIVFGIILVRLAQLTQIEEVDLLVVPWEKLWLRRAVGGMQAFLLFCVVTIMTAGVAALLEQMVGLPTWSGGAIFVLIVALIAISGVDGMVRVFSFLMPVLVISTIIFAVMAYREFGMDGIFQIEKTNTNPLMPNWFIASLTYVSYNMMGAIGIMTPVGKRVQEKNIIFSGITLGGLWMLGVAFSVLSSLAICPEALQAELPMVALATRLNTVLGPIYGVLLLLGMFCNALASLVADVVYLELKLPPLQSKRKLTLAVAAAAAWAASLFGFGDLIGIIYPAFGYCGAVFLTFMVIHFVKIKRQKAEA